MKRRTLLAEIGMGSAVIAGCVSDENERQYENRCGLTTFSYRHLPDTVKNEVDTAFSEGECTTEGNFYYELHIERPAEQAMRKGRTYYVANIEAVTTERSTLTFEETIPTFQSPRSLEMENGTDEPLDFEFTVRYVPGDVLTDSNGERLFRRNVSLEPQGRISLDILDKFTKYELTIFPEGMEAKRDEFSVSRTSERWEATIDEDELLVGGVGAGYRTCPWAPSAE